MAAVAVALTLEGVNLSQLASIQVPLAAGQAVWDAEQQQEDDGDKPMLMPPPLPAGFAALSRALAGVRALASPALPFAAHVLVQDQLRVVMLKSHVAAVFKLLRAQQGSLGIVVRDVKSQVSLMALPAAELEQACAAGLLASLLAPACGWWQLDEHRLLGASLLAPSPDGQAQACGSLTLGVHVHQAAANRLTLLVKPEQVEFRHPACRPGASLAARSASLAGSKCRLLPDFREGLIEGLRPADEATLQRLRPLWASYGISLPAEGPDHLVEVRLSDDPNAPTFPYPPCCVLSRYGLMSSADKLAAPAVQGVLVKLRDDLAATPFKFLGDKLRVAGPHVWYPDGAPLAPSRGREQQEEPPAAQLTFMTGRQHEQLQQGKGRGGATGRQLALGEPINLSGFVAGGGGGSAAAGGAAQQQGGQQQRKREHVVPDAKLQAYMDELKRQYADQQKPAAAAGQMHGLGLAAAATAGNGAVASAAARATPGKQQPLALRQAQAAAAAGGSASHKPLVPMFKKGGTAPAAAPKKATAQKRAGQGAAKPPAAAKRAKAAAVPASAAATPQASAAPGFLPSPGPALPTSCAATPAAAALAGTVPPSAAKPAAAAAAGAGTAGGAGAASAPPKPPARPPAKAADVDVAAVTAKVLAMHAAGTLGKLTIPELKAYLKSLRLLVGGKKGELEERARQALGGPAAGAAAANKGAPVEP